MGVRETVGKHPGIATAASILATLAALAVIAWEVAPKKYPPPRVGYFYTDDDGKNLFVDTMMNFPPFDHNGKEAVQAHVFLKDGQNTVMYLSKYDPDMQQILREGNPDDVNTAKGCYIKRPGEKDWVVQTDPAAQDILQDCAGLTYVVPDK
jgi:hypothetical protein